MSELLKAAALLDKDTISRIMLRDAPPDAPDMCMMGVLNIYYIVYANYILANGTEFNRPEDDGIRLIVRRRSEKILEFFESVYPIRRSKSDIGFLQWASWMGEPDETSIEDEFETSEELLLRAGFRKKDLDLWLACRKFDLFEARLLLASGANPNVHIPFCLREDNVPLPGDYRDIFDTDCVLWHTGAYAADFFECFNGMEYWKCAVFGGDISITKSYVPSLLQSAAYQIFYDAVLPYSGNFPE